MEKIIVDAKNFNTVEGNLNGRFAPYMGLNQMSYRQLVVKENELLQKLSSIVLKAQLPETCTKRLQSEEKKQQIAETQKVLQKVVALMKNGFHVALIFGMLKVTVGKSSGFDSDFENRFKPLYKDEACREDFWGTKEPVPFLIAISLLDSLMS